MAEPKNAEILQVKLSYRLDNADALEATLILTMSVGDWKRLKERLAVGQNKGAYIDHLIKGISDLVHTAHEKFENEVKLEL